MSCNALLLWMSLDLHRVERQHFDWDIRLRQAFKQAVLLPSQRQHDLETAEVAVSVPRPADVLERWDSHTPSDVAAPALP